MERKRYQFCIIDEKYINKCENVKCELYPCSFSQIAAILRNSLKAQGMSSRQAKKIGRTIAVNSFENGRKKIW